jgi:C1A family cysteine protease
VTVFLFTGLSISGSKVYAQEIQTDTPTLESQPTEEPTLEPTETGTTTVVPTDIETATLVPTDTKTSMLEPTETETTTLEPTLTETTTLEPTETETSTLEPTETETSTPELAETAMPAFSWELTLDYSNSSDANDSKAAAASQKLNKLAVNSKSENLGNGNYQLMLSGGGDVELIRLVIYEILLPDFNFLDGSAIISIQTTTTSGSPITVNLESQPGTGYTWGLNAPKTSTFTMQGTPTTTNRFDGPDTTALETMTLQPSVTGPSTLELIYQRPFEKSEAVTRHLTITLPDSVSSIDLSDPNPPVEASTNSMVGEFSAQNNLVQPETSTAGLPQSFDWRATNKVSDIRDLGSCGSCWAFGLTAVMESALRIDQNITADLSEQFLVSCNDPAKNTQCGQNKYNCEYGGCEDAQQYDVNTNGLNQSAAGAVLESQFPYTASDSACPANLTHAYQAASWNYVGGVWSPTVDQIKNVIYTNGPVTSRVCVGSAFDDYTGGEFTTDEGTCENHTIVLVGWDDNGWILRNSWGTGWGESGYMHIGWNVSGVGNGVTYVTMPVIPGTPTSLSPSGAIYIQKPTYQWSPVSNTTNYVLKVTNTDTNAVVVNTTVGTSACKGSVCSNTPSVALANGNYKLEVAAKNSVGQSDFSDPLLFSEGFNSAPFAPTLLGPSGTIYVLKPTYQWNPSGGSTPTGYVLKVTNTDTNVVAVNVNVSTSACKNGVCSNTPSTGLADGNYKFEVAAKNSFGQSDFSTPVTFTDAYNTPPFVPTLLSSPSGTIYVFKPTYQWNPSGGSAPTGYVLKVTNTDTNVVFVNNVSVSTSACKNGVCSNTPAISLTNGNYKLEVAGKNTFGQGAFSTPMTFTVFGFNSQFNGNARGWVPQAGGSWKTTSSYYYTNGYSGGGWSTSLFNATYTDFDYAARLKRVGGVYYDSTDSSYWAPANTLFVRTSGNAGYEFDYYDFGSVNYSSYSIWKNYSDGSWVNVTDASTTAVVNNNWNTLRVTASGDTLNFYINDQLVYTYTDSDFGSGAIGVGMSKITTASTTFEVDWATLGHYGSGSVALPQTIGAEQQALNAAGMNIPADQITRGKMKYIQSQ